MLSQGSTSPAATCSSERQAALSSSHHHSRQLSSTKLISQFQGVVRPHAACGRAGFADVVLGAAREGVVQRLATTRHRLNGASRGERGALGGGGGHRVATAHAESAVTVRSVLLAIHACTRGSGDAGTSMRAGARRRRPPPPRAPIVSMC